MRGRERDREKVKVYLHTSLKSDAKKKKSLTLARKFEEMFTEVITKIHLTSLFHPSQVDALVEEVVEAEHQLEEEMKEVVEEEEAALQDILTAQADHMKKIKLPVDLILGNPNMVIFNAYFNVFLVCFSVC